MDESIDIKKLMEDENIDESEQEACEAYMELGIADNLSNFEEAYHGQWSNDEDFAQETADSLGECSTGWPHYCIDWEYAARELMMDSSEENGYYFRNL